MKWPSCSASRMAFCKSSHADWVPFSNRSHASPVDLPSSSTFSRAASCFALRSAIFSFHRVLGSSFRASAFSWSFAISESTSLRPDLSRITKSSLACVAELVAVSTAFSVSRRTSSAVTLRTVCSIGGCEQPLKPKDETRTAFRSHEERSIRSPHSRLARTVCPPGTLPQPR